MFYIPLKYVFFKNVLKVKNSDVYYGTIAG